MSVLKYARYAKCSNFSCCQCLQARINGSKVHIKFGGSRKPYTEGLRGFGGIYLVVQVGTIRPSQDTPAK